MTTLAPQVGDTVVLKSGTVVRVTDVTRQMMTVVYSGLDPDGSGKHFTLDEVASITTPLITELTNTVSSTTLTMAGSSDWVRQGIRRGDWISVDPPGNARVLDGRQTAWTVSASAKGHFRVTSVAASTLTVRPRHTNRVREWVVSRWENLKWGWTKTHRLVVGPFCAVQYASSFCRDGWTLLSVSVHLHGEDSVWGLFITFFGVTFGIGIL